MRDHLYALSGGAPGQLPAILYLAFAMSAVAIPLLLSSTQKARISLILVITGSLHFAAGISTLLGYGLSLPAVYRWGGAVNLPPLAALLLILSGSSILLAIWRQAQERPNRATPWLPLPVVIVSATLTLILWIGLRDQETINLGRDTQIEINRVASQLNLALERQIAAIDRLSRRWSQFSETTEVIGEIDARNFFDEAAGSTSVARLSIDAHTLWCYPSAGNDSPLAIQHTGSPPRKSALNRTREKLSPAISGSVELPDGSSGFALYAPLYVNNKHSGYIVANCSYRRLIESIDHRLKLTGTYLVTIFLAGETIYDNAPLTPRDSIHRLESVFNIFDRRIRVEMTPSAENIQHNRRYLPELVLAAGMGITLLLGLSVHFALAAHSSLRSAEQSNRDLKRENEERRRIEEMLKLSEERLYLALESARIGIFEWSLPNNDLYFSPGVWTILGYKPGTVASTPDAWSSLIHPQDLPAYREAVEQQLAGTLAFIEPEYRVRSATDEWKWISSRAKIVSRKPAGPPTRIIGTLQDITARKEAEQALRASQSAARKLSLVASRTDNIVIIVSPIGTVEWINSSFERLLEYSLNEVVGRSPADFMIGPDTNPHTVRRIRVALAKGEGLSTDVINYSKSGRKYHLQLEIQPVRNEAGKLENFIAMLADITARVETENNLRRAKIEADAASKAKSEFLASMSHEIRTPMNGVIGMTSLLLDTFLNHEQRDYVSTIKSSGESLLTIINDILDFSKIESGKLELEQSPLELSVCVEDALDLFSVLAASKKIELAYHINDDVPPWIQGDITRLRQVLVNLVNNAVKFTPAGSISITVQLRPKARTDFDNPLIEIGFSVNDTGIGIPADRLDRLFKPFSQVDSSTTRKYGGTGLGLAISHRLTALMGGTINVSSIEGTGSTFSFSIQAEPVAVPPNWGLPEMPARLNYGPVICIEDHPVTQLRLQSFFQNWGTRAIVTTTTAGFIEAMDADIKPVAILADHELIKAPDQATLRERIFATELPILLVQSPGQSIDPAKDLPASVRFTTAVKPLRTPSLVRAMQTLFNPSINATTTLREPSEKLLSDEIPLTVLLVEDNLVNQKVALRFLDRLGYKASAANNGLEAVNAVASGHFQLVLMDLQMPEMDGLEASRQIRLRIPADRQPKIIALTANALHGDRELCLGAGMNDYITKPVKLLDIAKAIRRQFPS